MLVWGKGDGTCPGPPKGEMKKIQIFQHMNTGIMTALQIYFSETFLELLCMSKKVLYMCKNPTQVY